MSVLKRNMGLVVFCAAALVAAIGLGIMVQRHAARAAEFEDKVEAQREFFRRLKGRKPPVNKPNLDAITENLRLTEAKLAELKDALWNKSHIPFETAKGYVAIENVFQATREMETELADAGVVVAESAADFGFGAILKESDDIPDEDTEVPIILKQLKLVREIVRLVASSSRNSRGDMVSMMELVEIDRPQGLRVAQKEFFSVMPFTFVVRGNVTAVKQLVSSLQSDAKYLFTVQYFTVTSGNTAGQLLGVTPGRQTRSARKDGRTTLPPPAFEEDYARPSGNVRKDESEDGVVPKEERRIGLENQVEVQVTLHFLEFEDPKQEI